VRELTEIRWHARAGQGAKTASQILALALLRSGKSVQSFPEYGPERRGAPLRAYTRYGVQPVRRHDSVTEPNLVVVLDPTLLGEESVAEGVEPGISVIVNADGETGPVGGAAVRPLPTDHFATGGASFANVAMLGAVAATLGEPPLAALQDAIVEVLGKKSSPEALRAAASEGFAWLS
jgi:pyruvate ferredoxin oxidoreductase gamma subunit